MSFSKSHAKSPTALFAKLLLPILLTFAFTNAARAQSASVDYPTPIFSNEIAGEVAPRDLGDARLTRHFYTFNGTEGDLVLHVESTGLDGSIDLFAAARLRPLARVTLYAGAAPARVSRSIYLRSGEALVLRFEGRAAGEATGSYRVLFEGAFTPASGAPESAPDLPSLATSGAANAGRVNSAGARVAVPTEEIQSRDTAANDNSIAASTATAEEAAARTEPTEPATARTPRVRTPRTSSRAPRRRTNIPPAEADTNSAPSAATAPATTATRRRVPARTNTRRTVRPSTDGVGRTAAATSEEPAINSTGGNAATAAPVVTATRLVIEKKDGERVERDMSEVRRFAVDNNSVVVVLRDGRVLRVPLAEVSRMSLEP